MKKELIVIPCRFNVSGYKSIKGRDLIVEYSSDKIKFSVLIPVYNVEKYLRQCIESVLAQNYDDMEIILVDDGSTDNSGKICDEYENKDNRITVIHKKNEGVYIARSIAASVATGDYCIFLDSDDYWDEGLLNCICNTIKKYNCDMVLFNCREVYLDISFDGVTIFPSESVFEGNSKKKLYELLLEGETLNNLVLKVISMDVVKNDSICKEYKDIKKGEDALQGASLMVLADKIVHIPNIFYNYRKNVGVTSHLRVEDIISVSKSRQYILELLSKLNINLNDSFQKNYENYMNCIPKHILYGYIDNKHKIKHIFKEISNGDYYKLARYSSFKKLSLAKKIIILLMENEKYFMIGMISYIVKIRHFFRHKHV